MATVSETELEQRTSEYMIFVRDFAAKLDKDFVKTSKTGFTFYIMDGHATLEFSI